MNNTVRRTGLTDQIKTHSQAVIITLYFAVYCVIGLSMVFRQPFGNPPDEYNRYLIPQFILEHGTLPEGFDEEIRIGGYGFSYAFQPILPYMAQGYAMRFVSLFTDSEENFLYTGRLTDFLFGLATAYFVMLLGQKWFADRRFSWLFSFLAVFLPQSIFVHTYVNTDSCCMLSIALMLYAFTRCLEDRFALPSCGLLSAGIVLCALSYYNAYGYILSCILLFFAYFLTLENRSIRFSSALFLKRGLFIGALVLLGIGWWFIRSYLLYDGDILGLRTRDACASLYALPEFHPATRVTWQSRGLSLWQMVTQSDFLELSVLSFIGIYGPMTIVTSQWVYRFYKLLFGAGLLLFLALPAGLLSSRTGIKAGSADGPAVLLRRPLYRVFCHLNLVFCILMPGVLSLYYSYTTDYQPQGRYLLPALLPLCLYTVTGLKKGLLLCRKPGEDRSGDRLLTGLCTALCTVIVMLLFLTVYGYAFPYYAQNPIAP